MELPSKGWGPWRKEFYSYYSFEQQMKEDIFHECGQWRNVWVGKFSSFIYNRWPDFWRWFVNLPPLHRRSTKRLQKHFPNLR